MLVTSALLTLFVAEDGDGSQPDLVHADPGTPALLMGVGKCPHLTEMTGRRVKPRTAPSSSSHPQSRPRNCGLVTRRVPVYRTSGWPVIIASCSVGQSRSRSSARGRVRNRRGRSPSTFSVIMHRRPGPHPRCPRVAHGRGAAGGVLPTSGSTGSTSRTTTSSKASER
jgi:hypothetical protein